MRRFSADVLILRATDRGENDRLLTLLSEKEGRFYAILKGAHSLHRREAAASEPYTWSNIEFYEKNGVKWVRNATVLNAFPGIRYDMDKLFLAAYVADVAFELSDERAEAGEILPLTLNTLHMLSVTKNDNARIKAAFETRAAVIAGFAPDLSECRLCHRAVTGDSLFDIANGAPICPSCAKTIQATNAETGEFGERILRLPLTASCRAAISYIENSDAKRVFSFRLDGKEELACFSRVAEAYLLHHLERGFETLQNYKKLSAVSMRQTKPSEEI